MTESKDALIERLEAYRPTNEWGEGVHHVICTEAASALRTSAKEVEALKAAAQDLLDFIGPQNSRVYASDRPVRILRAAVTPADPA